MTRRSVYDRAYAAVRLFGPDLDPIEVTRALMIPPDDKAYRGEPNLRRYGIGRVRDHGEFKNGFWKMSTRDRMRTSRLTTHVEWLLAEMEQRAEALKGLLVEGVTADIFCFSSGDSERAPAISRELRSRAEALGLSISVDHYPNFTDEELAEVDAANHLFELRAEFRAFADGAIDVVEFCDRTRIPDPLEDSLEVLPPDLAEELSAYVDWMGGEFNESRDLIPRRDDWEYGVDQDLYGWIDVPKYRTDLRDALSKYWDEAEDPNVRKDLLSSKNQRQVVANIVHGKGEPRDTAEMLLNQLFEPHRNSDQAARKVEIARSTCDGRALSAVGSVEWDHGWCGPFELHVLLDPARKRIEAGRVDTGDREFRHDSWETSARRRLEARLRDESAPAFEWMQTYRRGETAWWYLLPDTTRSGEPSAHD